MICLRCGYCCVAHSVVLPDGTYKPSGRACPHLQWEGDRAICKLHGQAFKLAGDVYTWAETPCGRHTQVEHHANDKCRMGEFLRKQGKDGRDFERGV